eukprot:scaffold92534_cov69-Phaeocystis_antarctica.AAC.2
MSPICGNSSSAKSTGAVARPWSMSDRAGLPSEAELPTKSRNTYCYTLLWPDSLRAPGRRCPGGGHRPAAPPAPLAAGLQAAPLPRC